MSGRGGEVLLVVPPLSRIGAPALGVHVLQACARRAGFEVSVRYANVSLAAALGVRTYHALCDAPGHLFVGERLFAAAAYGVPPLGRDADAFLAAVEEGAGLALPEATLRDVERQARAWLEAEVQALAARPFAVVGCSTMFDQTAASFALLGALKRARPGLVTLLGGPNCEGPMAEGVAGLSAAADHVFSGESEETFVEFLRAWRRGTAAPRIVYGAPCRDLDALPPPRFDEYLDQLSAHLPEGLAALGEVSAVYETSRGCWWGEKHHCTFCGLNGGGMAFRRKSPGRVLEDLATLLEAYDWDSVQMADNIMPHAYFTELLPGLAALRRARPRLRVFYEQKANMTLPQVLALAEAGVTRIQPGIEALATPLLRRMDKGVTAGQNVALLRYARTAGLDVSWNLLWALPGDDARDYQDTLALLPRLRHLQPPELVIHVSIDRFSPYFERPRDFGIEYLAPWPGLEALLPEGADARRVAYHFAGYWPSGSRDRPDLVRAIEDEVRRWRADWKRVVQMGALRLPRRPALEVMRGDGGYWLLDTRGLSGGDAYEAITEGQAAAALSRTPGGDEDWALARGLGVRLDGRWVPLATAAAEVLLEFEGRGPAARALPAAPA